MRLSTALGFDPRWDGHDVHDCPACLASHPWVEGVFRAAEWQALGGDVKDVAHDPPPALIDAVRAVRVEMKALEARRMTDRFGRPGGR